jgi:hypothetical protein
MGVAALSFHAFLSYYPTSPGTDIEMRDNGLTEVRYPDLDPNAHLEN